MADINVKHRVEIGAVLVLNQAEIGALDALAGYGTDDFLKVFYEKMGKSYLQPYEAGLRSLFEAVRGCANGMEYVKRNAEGVIRGTHRAEPVQDLIHEPWRARSQPSLPLEPSKEPRVLRDGKPPDPIPAME